MFQINSMILRKMGWTDHSSPTFNSPRFDDNELVKFYIRPKTIYIFIKELTEKEKLISKNLYKFVVGKKSTEFNSNIELIKLIIEHEACNEEYQRHFKINKLLK
jgi:hypothetical protein